MALFTDQLAASGISLTELRILEMLDSLGAAGISEIASANYMRLSTVSRQVTRLIAVGSVERAPGGSDARHRVVRLTAEGRAELARYCEVRDELVRKHVVNVLEPDEYRTVAKAFRKIGKSV